MEEQTSRQQEEEKLVQQAYEHLEQTYLHSRHHGNVEPIRKAFNFAIRAYAASAASPTSCTPSPWRRLHAKR